LSPSIRDFRTWMPLLAVMWSSDPDDGLATLGGHMAGQDGHSRLRFSRSTRISAMVAFTPVVRTGNALWMNHPSGISCGSVSWTMRTLKCCGLPIGKGYFPVPHTL
jgi:hypothetical protein